MCCVLRAVSNALTPLRVTRRALPDHPPPKTGGRGPLAVSNPTNQPKTTHTHTHTTMKQEDEDEDENEEEPPPPPDLDDVPQEFMFDAVGVPMEPELLSFAAKQRQVCVCVCGLRGVLFD